MISIQEFNEIRKKVFNFSQLKSVGLYNIISPVSGCVADFCMSIYRQPGKALSGDGVK